MSKNSPYNHIPNTKLFLKTKCVSQLYAVHQALWSRRKQVHPMGFLSITDTYHVTFAWQDLCLHNTIA